jgi:hypothetical protein
MPIKLNSSGGESMTKGCCAVLLFFIVALVPPAASAVNEGMMVGFGTAMFNPKHAEGRLEGGKYNFVQIAYAKEFPLYKKSLNAYVEPSLTYVSRPNDGVEGGIGAGIRYFFGGQEYRGFYATAGTGLSYTSIKFKEQGNHGLFILAAGLGYRWKSFFLEDRFRHYSNAGLTRPNRSIHANILYLGMNF